MNIYFIFRSEGRKYNFVQHLKTLVLAMGLSLFLHGCNDSWGNENMGTTEINNIPPISESIKKQLRAIQKRKIVFGHHSVGKNILDGLRDLSTKAGVEINVVSINNNMSKDKLKFVDFYPGRNEQPKTKVDGFVNKIQELDPDYVPDIAFMKFCYIDILPKTDVETLFTYYKNNIIELKNKKPGITFLHFTAPLTSHSKASNVNRAKFNELLLKSFSADSIFDLAKVESTYLDGSREEFLYNGNTYYSLIPEYTTDGGHLNKFGRYIVATELVSFLSKVIEAKHRVIK